MGNGIAEEVAVAFKVVDGRIWSCDDAVAVAGFFLLLLGAHCDVDDDDIWSVFVRWGSRVVVGADFRKNEWVCWFVFFFSLSFGKSELYVCLLQLSTPSNVMKCDRRGWLDWLFFHSPEHKVRYLSPLFYFHTFCYRE